MDLTRNLAQRLGIALFIVGAGIAVIVFTTGGGGFGVGQVLFMGVGFLLWLGGTIKEMTTT